MSLGICILELVLQAFTLCTQLYKTLDHLFSQVPIENETALPEGVPCAKQQIEANHDCQDRHDHPA